MNREKNTRESKKKTELVKTDNSVQSYRIKRIPVLTGINPEMTGCGPTDPTLIFYREMTSSTRLCALLFPFDVRSCLKAI